MIRVLSFGPFIKVTEPERFVGLIKKRLEMQKSMNATMKRGVDIFGAVVALVLFSPFMLLTVIGIKVTSPGPVIFSQE